LNENKEDYLKRIGEKDDGVIFVHIDDNELHNRTNSLCTWWRE